MFSFSLALIAAAAAMLGGVGALRVARLSASFGGSPMLLAACWPACVGASALAAWLGAGIADRLSPQGGAMLAASVLLLAALDLAIPSAGRRPAEPTRSLGAIALAVGAAQLMSATGLVVFALAVATGAPWLAGAGSALGSGAALGAAWHVGGEWERRMPLAPVRYGTAGLLLAAALLTGLSARGLIG